MGDNEDERLDIEYKRYLQIIRPHLEKIVQPDVIDICNTWIEKLTNCKSHEKNLRNHYVFELCYQLAKGIIDKPFIDPPPEGELITFSVDSSEVSNSEVECIVIDSEDENSHIESTNLLYNKSQFVSSDYFSRNSLETCYNSDTSKCRTRILTPKEIKEDYYEKSFFCYTCPEMKISNSITEKAYISRARNLIDKLRDMKKQNILLHNELKLLKEETRNNIKDDEHFRKVSKLDSPPSAVNNESNGSFSSIKKRLKEVQESRNNLIETVSELQEKLDKFNETKKMEIEDMESEYKLEIIKLTTIQNELKENYENQLKDLKRQHDEVIKKLKENTANDIQDMAVSREKIICDKDEVIKLKDAEIHQLRIKLEDEKNELKKVINTYEKADEDSARNVEKKMLEMEKRLKKAEKSRIKCAKIYESKLAYLQREKHLMECSLQLHLLRQRAQIINEVTDENQTELISGFEKLESKYKEIVANMQATAIQRRIQDQVAIESIFQVACNVRGENVPINTRAENRSQLSGKTIRNQNVDENRCSEEMSSVLLGNKVENVSVNKTFPEDSTMAGYYLDRERLGELFERVYIPQRDTSDRQK